MTTDPRTLGLTVEQAQKIVDEFLAAYNGNIQVKAVIKATQEEIYGPDASREKVGYRIDAAYHPARCLFTLAASNMGDAGAVRRALRHELLGHYGLNTFPPDEKRALLDRVLETRQEPSLAPVWASVERHYKGLSKLHQAEEVFAFVAEQERSFLGRAWDKTCAALQKALRASGLSENRPLSVHELRQEALSISRGIREGRRHQQTFPQDDFSQFRLSEDEHGSIYHDIREQALATTRPVQRPTAVILGGQPGAGKAALTNIAMQEFAGNTVKVDADELRKYHPHYLQLMRDNDRDAADLTHPDAGSWAVKLTSAAIQHRRNLVIDGTMRDPESLAKLCTRLQGEGYTIDARVLAVHELVSRLSIHQRYELQREANGFGRWTNRDKHDQAFAGLPLTVGKLEGESLVDRMAVYARNGHGLYENLKQVEGWTQDQPLARLHVETERGRDWTPQEHQIYQATLNAVQAKMHQRGAAPADLAVLEALRKDYDGAHQRRDSTRPSMRG